MAQIAHLHCGQSRFLRLVTTLGLTVHAAMRAILLRITLIDVSLWVLANITSRLLAALRTLRRRRMGSQVGKAEL